MDHENSKKLHEIGRGGHENLPGSNRERFRRTMLPKFALEVLSSNTLCWVKISNDIKILNFLLFIEIFWNFYPRSILFYHFGPFKLIWCCRSPFWVRFDRGFDPFMPTVGNMSKLAYRLGFTSSFILHNIMTISF